MSYKLSVTTFFKQITSFVQYELIVSKYRNFESNLSFEDIMYVYPTERKRYEYFLWSYRNDIDKKFVQHRNYFRSESRGFGEDAFHAMWVNLFASSPIKSALEIGVYRGQTISLWNLISLDSDTLGKTEYWGLSPLNNSGDEVSAYINIDYESDIRQSFNFFNLGEPRIFKAFSTDSTAKEFILSNQWDLVYVDGSHEQSIVENDVMLSYESLKVGGFLVMDDSSLYSPFKAPIFAFKGHPGPSKVAKSLESKSGLKLVGTCGHNRIYKKITDRLVDIGQEARLSNS